MNDLSSHTLEYTPTPAERRLMVEMSNPENLNETITTICRRAQVDRGVYYSAIQKPEFKRFQDKMISMALMNSIRQVVGATIKSAIDPHPSHFNDRKILLEMAGQYIPQMTLNAGIQQMTDDQLRESARKLIEEVKPSEIKIVKEVKEVEEVGEVGVFEEENKEKPLK